MSNVVSETIRAVNINKIPDRILLYEQLIDAAEPLFSLDAKGLEQACKEHAQNLMMYDQTLQECKTIEDTIRSKIEEIESELFKKFLENHQRALNTREIPQYIKGDPKYVAAYEILLEVVHVKRKLESIVEALKSMGWMLNNITKLRIAQLEKSIL